MVVARCAHGSMIWIYSVGSLIWSGVRSFCLSLHCWFELLGSCNGVQAYGSWSLICEGDIPGSIGRIWRTGDRPVEFFDSGIHCRSRSALRYDHLPGCLYVVIGDGCWLDIFVATSSNHELQVMLSNVFPNGRWRGRLNSMWILIFRTLYYLILTLDVPNWYIPYRVQNIQTGFRVLRLYKNDSVNTHNRETNKPETKYTGSDRVFFSFHLTAPL